MRQQDFAELIQSKLMARRKIVQAAIERLGFGPCMHMAHILPHADRSQLMLDAIRERDREKRQKIVRELMAGHASVADLPVIYFAADLMDMYPDAAIVLNLRRSGVQWAASAKESFQFFFSWRFLATCLFFRNDRQWYWMNRETIGLCRRLYGTPIPWSIELYDGHRQFVLNEAKKRGRRVLEFMPEQGWGPLCEFLGTEAPDEPFPRLNEKETFQLIRRVFIMKGLLSWAALGVGVWTSWRFGPSAFGHLQTMWKAYR
ncbi:hypothetical protein SAMD00023353_5100200 [Rosellinia necatrix]|uniref:Uncharacterized protein n=1 Tax=Rosellinia necatrix TaxID=77044 RepID=A0A1W2TR04_ROSNE|nr:hypothetical protein SAMD00023353_5100200 [Rosellinia necatrix]